MSEARVSGRGAIDGDGGSPGKVDTKLPGASATAIRVPSFLNSMPRLLLKTRCSLRSFLLCLVSSPGPVDGSTSLPSSTTWPMPIPYPEVFRSGASVRVVEAHWKKLVSLQVVTLSWLALGCPDRAPSEIRLGRRLSAGQWSAVRMLEHLGKDGNTPELVEAQDMGRAAGKVEDMEDHLGVLARAVSSVQTYENVLFCSRAFKTCS